MALKLVQDTVFHLKAGFDRLAARIDPAGFPQKIHTDSFRRGRMVVCAQAVRNPLTGAFTVAAYHGRAGGMHQKRDQLLAHGVDLPRAIAFLDDWDKSISACGWERDATPVLGAGPHYTVAASIRGLDRAGRKIAP